MRNFNTALDKLIQGFEGFTDELRNMADELPADQPDDNVVHIAGAGEEPDFEPAVRVAGDGIDDGTVITMKSGDLRKVVDSYRRFVRYAREGRIPDADERFKLHQSVRAVKHLIRKPHR